MIGISVKLDVKELTRGLADAQKQVRFATAVALTKSAKFAEEKVKEEIARAFDRPTRFTLNSTYIKPATKANLVAEVGIKDAAFKAVAPIKWLAPQIYGGPRQPKRFEELLRKQGILGPTQYAVPGSGARIDRYGNMSRGQIVQILSALRAQRDPLQNSSSRSQKRNRRTKEYFAIGTQRGRLGPGVYLRNRTGNVLPVLIFVSQPRYTKRLRFYEVAEGAARMRFPVEFGLALRKALATAR